MIIEASDHVKLGMVYSAVHSPSWAVPIRVIVSPSGQSSEIGGSVSTSTFTTIVVVVGVPSSQNASNVTVYDPLIGKVIFAGFPEILMGGPVGGVKVYS